MIVVLTGALLLTTVHAGAGERGTFTAADALDETGQDECKSQINDEMKIASLLSNLDEPKVKFWLAGTDAYRIDPGYSPVILFENRLGGEGIEVKPGTKTRQAYLIKDGRAERLEKALDTRFYRAEHFTEAFPRDFDYLGFCDYRERVMTLVPNPFAAQAPSAESSAPASGQGTNGGEAEECEEYAVVYACSMQTGGAR